MTDLVKRFIEENIDYIEKEDWYTVFYSWYLHYGDNNYYTDGKNLDEFCQAMEVAYPDFSTESYEVRKTILRDKMEEYINFGVQIGMEHIRYTACIDSLNSTFGIHEYFLKQTFKEAAKNCGFELGRNYIIEVE